MASRRSHIDQAIDKLTDDIKVLELARQRLIAERDAKATKPAKPRVVKPRSVNEKAGGE